MSCHLEDGSIGPSTIDIVPSSCAPHNMSHGITTGLCGLGRTAQPPISLSRAPAHWSSEPVR